ncbi:MAG TPA: rhomboid family intramembrane serine protease [Jatrophihabitantaceae bacterium]|nr:rhomboid family intramembrane serine protease [Jatrophihabitantaceae bacterium]
MSSPRPSPFPRRSDQPRAPRTEPPLDPNSWTGALIIMCVVGALVWIVQAVNASDDYGLDRFGVKPREIDGLWGLLTMPFLHASYSHLLSNTIPLVLIGWVLLLSGLRTWATVTALVVVLGGALTWLIGPSHSVIVGASGMIFGWLGYLLARAYFSRKLRWIIVAVLVLIFFGTLLFGLFPNINSDVSWQAHVSGFAAGVGVGALLHPRGGSTRLPGRSVVS